MAYNMYRLSGGYALPENEIVNANSIDEFLEWYRYTRNLSGDLPFFINTSGFNYTFLTDEIFPKQISTIAFNKSTKKEMADALDIYFKLRQERYKKEDKMKIDDDVLKVLNS